MNGKARCASVAGLTAVLLGSSLMTAPATAAYAASAKTTSSLAALTQQVDDAAATYEQASGKVDELNQQIAQMADEILDFEQNTLPAQQQKASDAASRLYKLKASSTNVVSMLLNSSSLGELITQGKYLTTIQDESTAELERLNSMHDELEDKMAQLSQAKDDAEAQQATASQALAQAQSAQQQMEERAKSEDAAEAAAAAQAAQAAAAKTASMQQASASSSSAQESNAAQSSSTSSSGSSSSASSSSNSGSQSASSNSGNASSDSGTQSAWKSGVASYYGIGDGFMGGTTASGAIVTETSMGVAMLNVPLGTRVEIRYGGKSVVAVVNDRGPYAHGRVIDMQPAVARALGFVSVGVGTVQYRFL